MPSFPPKTPDAAPNPPRLLKPPEVADRLSLHVDTVKTYLRSNRLPGVKIGRVWRVRESDLVRWIEERDRSGEIPPTDEMSAFDTLTSSAPPKEDDECMI